ncbi:MAG: AraC family transcriptional regulator [Planctomycetota bacterium]
MPTPTAAMPEPTCPHTIQVDFAAYWRAEKPYHYVYRVPCLQLLLVESGRLSARAGGTWWHAGPGDLLCLGREARNEYSWNEPSSFWECHLSLGGAPTIDGGSLPPLVALGTHAAIVQSAMEVFCRELDRPGDTHRLRVQVAAWQIFAAVAEQLGRAPAPERSDSWQQVRDRLDSAFDQTLVVADVASAAGMTEDGFIRAFRRRHGISPMAWRAQAKMRQACRLLGEGVAVKTVATRLGFADPSAFARTFRRHIGIPPSDYAVVGPAAIPAGSTQASRPFAINQHILPP